MPHWYGFCQNTFNRSDDGKGFFQQVDAQSLSEDRVVIGNEDARAERVPVDSPHEGNPSDPPDSRFEAYGSGFGAW
jgi:hypothetical protein